MRPSTTVGVKRWGWVSTLRSRPACPAPPPRPGRPPPATRSSPRRGPAPAPGRPGPAAVQLAAPLGRDLGGGWSAAGGAQPRPPAPTNPYQRPPTPRHCRSLRGHCLSSRPPTPSYRSPLLETVLGRVVVGGTARFSPERRPCRIPRPHPVASAGTEKVSLPVVPPPVWFLYTLFKTEEALGATPLIIRPTIFWHEKCCFAREHKKPLNQVPETAFSESGRARFSGI